jgi:ZIP family zinc transporter
VGQVWVSEAVSIVFFALAAGSILYVVMELLNVSRALAPKTLVTWGIMLGLFLGFATDFILVAAGA